MSRTLPHPAGWLRRAFRRRHVLTWFAAGAFALALVWWGSRHSDDGTTEPGQAEPLADTEIKPRTGVPERIEKSMRRELAVALGYVGEAPAAERVRQLMGLRKVLTPDESNELLRFLLSTGGDAVSSGEGSTLFHEVANQLQRQSVDLRVFAEVLATVARDDKRPEVYRDYALQHLRRVWSSSSADGELQGSITATFQEIARHPGILQASALLSLHLIDPRGRIGAGAGELRDEVGRILSVSGATNGTDSIRLKMAAARIAGERHMDDQRDALLRISSAEGEHALVRMSAVSALGRIADASDLQALASLSPADERVATAIRHATSPKP